MAEKVLVAGVQKDGDFKYFKTCTKARTSNGMSKEHQCSFDILVAKNTKWPSIYPQGYVTLFMHGSRIHTFGPETLRLLAV